MGRGRGWEANDPARKGRQRSVASSRGFTLIEALVTLAVVAAVLGAIGGAVATTVRGTRTLDARLALAGTAQALLTTLPRESLQPGQTGGQSGGFGWRVEVAPLPPGDASAARWRPVAVDIRVQQPGGGFVQLKTVRLIAQAAP